MDGEALRTAEAPHSTSASAATRSRARSRSVAEGSVQTRQTVAVSMEEAQKGLAVQLEAFAANP